MNKELKLNDEQLQGIREAAEEIRKESSRLGAMAEFHDKTYAWVGTEFIRQAIIRNFVAAPLAEPTEEEIEFATANVRGLLGTNGLYLAMEDLLTNFVSRRNAPPTVDTRREKIVEILSSLHIHHDIADKILLALDEASK